MKKKLWNQCVMNSESIIKGTEYEIRKKFEEVFKCNLYLEQEKVDIFKLTTSEDLNQLITGTGFYVILTDCKFKDNKCSLIHKKKYKAIYRGEGSKLRLRVMSHLFNDYYNDNNGGTNYDVCIQIEAGETGINIDKDPYNRYEWYVIQHKMSGSNSLTRKQVEQAFDNIFKKPFACHDKN